MVDKIFLHHLFKTTTVSGLGFKELRPQNCCSNATGVNISPLGDSGELNSNVGARFNNLLF